MQSSVDATIAGLRGAVSAKTDAELARMLGVDQSTISAWRARGRVPERFVKMVDGAAKAPSSEAPQVWGELQERAQTIALVRFTLIRREVVFSGNVDKALGLFLDLKPYWLILNRAVHELRLKMEASRVDLKTAAFFHLEAEQPHKTVEQVARSPSSHAGSQNGIAHLHPVGSGQDDQRRVS